jgi:cell division protease FtsH
MVCQWGMSELGPLAYGERDDLIFLGRDLAMNKNFSERTSELIDEQVKKIIGKSYVRSQELLESNKDKLTEIAKLLLEKEVLDSDEIEKIAGVVKASRPQDQADRNKPGAQESPAPEKTEEPGGPQVVKPLDKPDLVKV